MALACPPLLHWQSCSVAVVVGEQQLLQLLVQEMLAAAVSGSCIGVARLTAESTPAVLAAAVNAAAALTCTILIPSSSNSNGKSQWCRGRACTCARSRNCLNSSGTYSFFTNSSSSRTCNSLCGSDPISTLSGATPSVLGWGCLLQPTVQWLFLHMLRHSLCLLLLLLGLLLGVLMLAAAVVLATTAAAARRGWRLRDMPPAPSATAARAAARLEMRRQQKQVHQHMQPYMQRRMQMAPSSATLVSSSPTD